MSEVLTLPPEEDDAWLDENVPLDFENDIEDEHEEITVRVRMDVHADPHHDLT